MDQLELETKLNGILDIRSGMLASCERENRNFTAEEQRKFDQLEVESRYLEKQIDGVERPHMADFNSQARGNEDLGMVGNPRRALLGESRDAKGFKNWGDYLRTVLLEPQNKRSMDSWSGADGGFAVPSYLMAQVWDLLAEKSFAFGRCWIVPVPDGSGNSLKVAMWDSFDKSGGNPVAGIHGTWMAENTTGSEQTPQLKAVEVFIHKVGLFLSITRELLSDSILSSQRIAQIVTSAITYAVDRAVLRGSGLMPEPLGVFNTPSVVSVARTTANSIVYADCVNLLSRIYPPNIGNTAWIVSPSALTKLLTMQDGGSHYVWTPNQSVIGGQPQTLLGRPIYVSQFASQLGTRGDLSVIDFSQFMIATRGSLIFQTSDAVHWTADRVAMRGLLRLGMLGTWPVAVNPEFGTDALSWAAILG